MTARALSFPLTLGLRLGLLFAAQREPPALSAQPTSPLAPRPRPTPILLL